MSKDIISKKTRYEFREFLVGWKLREIGVEFDAADISLDENHKPKLSGARRGLVEQYYHSLDFTSPADTQKLLKAYENILNTALGRVPPDFFSREEEYRENMRKVVERLADWLRKDGFLFKDGRIVSAAGTPPLRDAKRVALQIDADYVHQQLARMESAVDADPDLAIGTAKEFVETICKTILHEVGTEVASDISITDLVKKVRGHLELLPDDIPEKAKGAETIKRVLNNLGSVAQGLAELRTLYGTGHGRKAGARGLHARHARLAVGAASTLAIFLFETYQERTAARSEAADVK